MTKLEQATATDLDMSTLINHPSSEYEIVVVDRDGYWGIIEKESGQEIITLTKEQAHYFVSMVNLAAKYPKVMRSS